MSKIREIFPAPFLHLDVLDLDSMSQIISQYSIKTIYNLAAILSADGEKDPDLCERVNLGGLQNVLMHQGNMGVVSSRHHLSPFSAQIQGQSQDNPPL